MSDVTMDPVRSSNVEAVGYDVERQVLVVRYRGGASYEYDGVSADERAEGLAADSVGGWLARRIKPSKDCRRIA